MDEIWDYIWMRVCCFFGLENTWRTTEETRKKHTDWKFSCRGSDDCFDKDLAAVKLVQWIEDKRGQLNTTTITKSLKKS